MAGLNTIGRVETLPEPTPEIPRQLERLDSWLSSAEGAADAVDARLSPVIQAELPESTKNGSVREAMQSQVGAKLQDMTDRLQRLTLRLQGIVNRACV